LEIITANLDVRLRFDKFFLSSGNKNSKWDTTIFVFGFDILYRLPQNKSGVLSVFDLQGRLIHGEALPPWSTKQNIAAGNWSQGVYQVIIESDGSRGAWKWVKF
jgi:hypothetical protein